MDEVTSKIQKIWSVQCGAPPFSSDPKRAIGHTKTSKVVAVIRKIKADASKPVSAQIDKNGFIKNVEIRRNLSFLKSVVAAQ